MGNEKLIKLTQEIMECTACQLHKSRTHVVPGTYGKIGGICFIGEAPGYYEDQQGLPFVGRSGKLLDKMLDNVGLKREDVSILNVVKCRPTTDNGSNRTPTIDEIKFCAERWLLKQLAYLKPKIIVTLGSSPLKFFFSDAKITKEAGKIKMTSYGYKLFATYHPAYLLRNPKSELLEQYENHFRELVKYSKNKDEHVILNKEKNKKSKRQKTLVDFFG